MPAPGDAKQSDGRAQRVQAQGLPAMPLITESVRRYAREQPDKPAVIEVGEGGVSRQWTFAELEAQAGAWAEWLPALGVATGEPVAYQLPNRLEFVAISLGALAVGAVCEPLMPIFRERELEFMLAESAARVLIVPERWRGHDHGAMARGLAERLERLEHVVAVLSEGGVVLREGAAVPSEGEVVLREGAAVPSEGGVVSREDAAVPSEGEVVLREGAAVPSTLTPVDGSGGAESWSEGRRPAGEGSRARAKGRRATSEGRGLTPEMTAQLLFTSGSTGEPKGVLQNHASLNAAARMHIDHFGLTADDVIYAPSPLAHQTGFLYGMWIALTLGATQVIQSHWDAEVAFDAITGHGVTFVQAATPFLADLVRVASERGRRAEPLRIFVATGAAIPRELARESRAVLGAQVGGAFGTTESCLGAAFVPGVEDDRAWSSDGRVLDGITLRTTDDEGNVLPAGQEGNFEVLTPTLFEGYLNRPELTAEALTPDGYYRTGDLARIDADGYLKITGRVKDVINRGGEKVPVVEVEQVLYRHPAVRQVAIVAMPDPRLGERACAFVVLEADAEADFDFVQMQQYLEANRVAKPYWPERLEVVPELPHTPSGKVQKYVLRERLRALSV